MYIYDYIYIIIYMSPVPGLPHPIVWSPLLHPPKPSICKLLAAFGRHRLPFVRYLQHLGDSLSFVRHLQHSRDTTSYMSKISI